MAAKRDRLSSSGLLLGLKGLGKLVSQLVDGPESLEAVLGAEAGNLEGHLGVLALGADQLSTLLLTLRVGTLDVFGSIGGVVAVAVGADFRHHVR